MRLIKIFFVPKKGGGVIWEQRGMKHSMSKDKLMFITMIQAIIYAVKYLREILLNRLIKGLYHISRASSLSLHLVLPVEHPDLPVFVLHDIVFVENVSPLVL